MVDFLKNSHFTLTSLLSSTHILNMTVLRTMLVVYAMLGASASCSSSYKTHWEVDQESQGEVNIAGHGGITIGQMTSFVSQIQQAISDSQMLSGGQSEPRPGVEQRPEAASAVSDTAPTTTQYLCSCITITPLAPAHHAPASVSPVTDAFASAEASAAQSCSSGSVSAPGSDDCVHQHAAQSSPVQETTGTSHSAYAANKEGY